MSKHTPGPWIWEKDFRGLYGAGKDADVLHWEPYDGMWLGYNDCQQANARLIAAAPEGLDAAMLAYEILADIRNQWKGRETPEGQIALVCLRDFIAKATGRDAQEVQDDFTNRRIAA